ncbi:hypothetical protein P692DRAFT_20376400 [Suillus brevipes Sb2]|nr:hypothetical protein P692DRAFT_20376400 [Suillus brevipes Sb2]
MMRRIYGVTFTLLRPTLCYGFLSDLSGAMLQDGPCYRRSYYASACPAWPKRVHVLVSITSRLDLC